MKTKQLIERNLPFTDKYTYMGINRGSIESGQFTTCQNCGQLITNMVDVIRHSDRKHYTIGTDCAETLVKARCLYNNGSQTDYEIDIYSYNIVARFITEVNAGCEITNNGFYCTITNRKGKEVKVFTQDLKKFFPQYI